MGPQSAPANGTRQVAIDAAAAAQLAWYFQSDIGVLAPRGWHCLELAGSAGTQLYVFPGPLSADQMLRPGFKGLKGPAIQLSFIDGGTSGRFNAAHLIARLFPQERRFVDGVIAEGGEPASGFPSGPYPDDQLTRRGSNIVEYMTPAGKKGLGYDSWLVPGGDPVTGVVILPGDADHDVVHLAIRLPQALRGAAPAIIRQVEADHPAASSAPAR
ncbi:MAG TPA: hypothetical protein VMH77_06760 [Steroidobacteraceae bacterium]|nr:hypothetical protein [Steroidobacteraceae bacterium]